MCGVVLPWSLMFSVSVALPLNTWTKPRIGSSVLLASSVLPTLKVPLPPGLPPIVVVVLMQRWFVAGLTEGEK